MLEEVPNGASFILVFQMQSAAGISPNKQRFREVAPPAQYHGAAEQETYSNQRLLQAHRQASETSASLAGPSIQTRGKIKASLQHQRNPSARLSPPYQLHNSCRGTKHTGLPQRFRKMHLANRSQPPHDALRRHILPHAIQI